MKYVIANWKANKTMTEAKQWVEEFLKNDFSDFTDKVEIIICPPFPFLTMIWGKTQAYSFIKVGSQDVSSLKKELTPVKSLQKHFPVSLIMQLLATAKDVAILTKTKR